MIETDVSSWGVIRGDSGDRGELQRTRVALKRTVGALEDEWKSRGYRGNFRGQVEIYRTM